MKLSIVMPTNRTSLSAYARILDACSFASDDVEVIVRDNSQSESKHSLLSQINKENCTILCAGACSAEDNASEALRLAKGQFVFFLADDDVCTKGAIDRVVHRIIEYAEDNSVVGITGQYALEDEKGLRIFGYPSLRSDSAYERIDSYLSTNINVILYSAMRLDIVRETLSMLRNRPCFFSFTDQIYVMCCMLNGKFVDIGSVIYNYDLREWGNAEIAKNKDIRSYEIAGLDCSILRIHWLICAMEGMKTIFNPSVGGRLSLGERQCIAQRWFSVMHNRFRGANTRIPPFSGGRFDAESAALRDKWLSVKDISLDSLLADICGFMALSSPETAFKYYSYWSSL